MTRTRNWDLNLLIPLLITECNVARGCAALVPDPARDEQHARPAAAASRRAAAQGWKSLSSSLSQVPGLVRGGTRGRRCRRPWARSPVAAGNPPT